MSLRYNPQQKKYGVRRFFSRLSNLIWSGIILVAVIAGIIFFVPYFVTWFKTLWPAIK